LIQKDKELIFKLLKDINERLPSLPWKAHKYYSPKSITLLETVQTPSLQERTQEIYTLLNRACNAPNPEDRSVNVVFCFSLKF